MSRIVIIGALAKSLLNFRGELIKNLKSAGHDVIALAADSDNETEKELAHIGVAFRTYPIKRNSLSPIEDLKTYLSLRKNLKALKPDIVFSYTVKPIIWSGLALKTVPAPDFYALVTGLGYAFQSGAIGRNALKYLVFRLYQASLSRASRVIFQNHDNLDFFISHKIIEQEKCELVNGSGVDLDHFSFTGLPPYRIRIVFLTIGRLLGEKGFREYAKAAQIVKQSYPESVFRLVGPMDPSPDAIPIDTINKWHDQGWVEYLGETADVRPFISDCHIFVLPSYHEGMPRTVLEAMAMGRPILTTDVPGCRETVIDGRNGFLVPRMDPDALAERMIWFIKHSEEWTRMGLNSRKIAEEKFSVHDVNKKILRIMGLN